MDILEEQQRVLKMMDIGKQVASIKFQAMPGICTPEVIKKLIEARTEIQELIDSLSGSEELLDIDTLMSMYSDTTEFIGRAYDTLNQLDKAAKYYMEAKSLYTTQNKQRNVALMKDKLAEINLMVSNNFDAEIERLLEKLLQSKLEYFERIQIEIQLGEVYSKIHDDFEAKKHLHSAEELLEKRGCLGQTENTLLEALIKSNEQLIEGTSGSENSPIVKEMFIRSLLQRLYFALANSYRDTNPEKAKEYEDKISSMDNSKNRSLEQSMVGALMGQLEKFTEI